MSTEANVVLCAALEWWKARQKLDSNGAGSDREWDEIEEKKELLHEAIDTYARSVEEPQFISSRSE